MLGRTHRAYSDVFWLATTGVVDALAYHTGHGEPFSIVAVGAGVFLAKPFSSGRNLSPDMDQRWAPGRPRNFYDWRYHRGFTHRVWFASMLTVLFGVIPFVALVRVGLPVGLATLVFAPAGGWCSHLSGDMLYGRIKILGKPVGLGWATGGLSETGRPVGGGKRWLPTNPAEKVFLNLAAVLILGHVVLAIMSLST